MEKEENKNEMNSDALGESVRSRSPSPAQLTSTPPLTLNETISKKNNRRRSSLPVNCRRSRRSTVLLNANSK